MKKKRLIIFLLTLALLPLSSVRVMSRVINLNVGYVDPQNPKDELQARQVLLLPGTMSCRLFR